MSSKLLRSGQAHATDVSNAYNDEVLEHLAYILAAVQEIRVDLRECDALLSSTLGHVVSMRRELREGMPAGWFSALDEVQVLASQSPSALE